MRIAVVTGASSGLGKEYIRQIGDKMSNLDEIWAIARRKDRLIEIQKKCPVPVRPIDMDLTCEENICRLESMLQKERPVISILINAAGFGKTGDYKSVDRKKSDEMIRLNCQAAVDVTMICLPYMKAKSRILEICSTAAFQPFQYLNVYAASKAFLYRYSRALAVELRSRKITVTAVCPYWIKDTEFIPIARQNSNDKTIRHFPLASHSKNVVSRSLSDNFLGLSVSTPGPVCLIHRIGAKFLPSGMMMGIWALIRRI